MTLYWSLMPSEGLLAEAIDASYSFVKCKISACVAQDRGRSGRLGSTAPPSKPDVQISRIRLSSRWCHLRQD
jgi:hypothetical protein